MLFQLKIHGYGYQYLFFEEEHYFCRALNELAIEKINEIIFDSDLLSKMKLYNKSAGLLIENPYLAEPSETGFLYSMDLISRLEIKPKTGKRIKFKFYDLRNEELLFGFPNVITTGFGKKGILVLEKCLGYFGRTKLLVPQLKFEDLKFEIVYLNEIKERLIEKIYYKEELLEFGNDELICQSKRAYII